MERIKFDYCLKNIPIPSRKSHQLQLIDKTESAIKRMRWKAHFSLSNTYDTNDNMDKETYGFKSKHHPGIIKELERFEKYLFDIANSLKFRNTTDDFQKQLKEDVSSIISSSDVLIFADKTNNIYKATPEQYKKLLKENEDLQKSSDLLGKSINMEAKHIAKKLELSDRIGHLPRNFAFITLNDRKENFSSKLLCRLINPLKSKLGKVSKQKLEKINKVMVQHLNVNQWKNSTSVIKWFTALENRTDYVFTKFDIQEIYPFITEDILKTSLSFANEYQNMHEEDIRIINHCRNSLLFSNNQPCKKKDRRLLQRNNGKLRRGRNL